MAWGYWTTYSTHTVRPPGQETQQQTLSPPSKRDRSLESRDRERLVQVETNHRAHGSGSLQHKPYQSNHVEAEKVAFERKLLLGDPDWSSRTVADRNTLPRKKHHDYERSLTSEALYGKNGHSPATTPIDSVSRKSDDTFCPACAQHNTSHTVNNRDSRVSFGSLASSSRGSSSARGGSSAIPIPMRSRSRSHDEEERSSYPHGRAGGPNLQMSNFSSSLPTPPPPPFSSHRDIRHHHPSFMETINQKISILSSFKPKFHFLQSTNMNSGNTSSGHHNPLPQHDHHRSSRQHRRSVSMVRPPSSGGDYLDHSSSSLHDNPPDRRGRMNDCGQQKSISAQRGGVRVSARNCSSGSRGHSRSTSSRRSHESIVSCEQKQVMTSSNNKGRQRSNCERVPDDDYGEDRDGGDEESDELDNNNLEKIDSRNLPKDPPSMMTKDHLLEKVSSRKPLAMAGPSSSTTSSKSTRQSDPISRNSKDFDEPEEVELEKNGVAENYETMRRKVRGKNQEGNGSQLTSSLRSSQSQTPDDEEPSANLIEVRRLSCRRHGSGTNHKPKLTSVEDSGKQASNEESQSTPGKKAGGKGSNSTNTPPMRHFKHFDHNEFPPKLSKDSDHMIINTACSKFDPPKCGETTKFKIPRRGDEYCHRPRSASMGNHLSDVGEKETSRHLPHHHHHSIMSHHKNHTLDGFGRHEKYRDYSSSQGADENSFHHQQSRSSTISGGAPSSHSVSSKSEKSSRSSQSPSVENLRHGETF